MRKKIILTLFAGAVAAALLLIGCSNQSTSEQPDNSDIPASTDPMQSASSSLLPSLSSEELQKLVSGEITLTELEQQLKDNFSAPSADSSAEIPAAGNEQATASDSTSSAYEEELQELLQQLYAVKSEAETSLNSIIASAKAEYKDLPAEKQTTARKIAIVMGKTSELQKLQSSCDKKVDTIVNQMRTLLTENGQSTDLADQAQASYESQKKAMISTLTSELYS